MLCRALILDFDDLDPSAELAADVCIVGSGAAGISIALELIGTRHEVLVLEGGGEGPEPDSQRLYDTEIAEVPFESAQLGRARQFGGTTTLWAGQLLPLAPFDFQARDWVDDSGWPFGRDTVEPYYRRAERVMQVPALSYDAASWPRGLARPPDLDGDRLEFRHSVFSGSRNLATAYRERLAAAPNVRVVTHANVTEVVTSGPAVERLELKSLAGKIGAARGRHYVICCGGIETVRLLLASPGVADGRPLLGRYFQDHMNLLVEVHPARKQRFRSMFNTRRVGSTRYYPKIAATEKYQREERLLAVGADVCYVPEGETGITAAKRVIEALRWSDRRSELPGAAAAAIRRSHQLVAAGYRHVVLKQKPSENIGPTYLGAQVETKPSPDSRITLAERRDALGMPLAIVDWRTGDTEAHTVEVFMRFLAGEFRRAGLGEVDLSGLPLPSDRKALHEAVMPGHHHLGATRMHPDPAHGVVDSDCQVHGLDNLHVASGSVFPSGGFSNPTLTIIALSLRLADRLKGELL
jgi:choline dehydrogenase-like flavoprotein